MSKEWISAAHAFDLISEAIGNSRSTARTICARAHAGLISARAKRFIVGGLPEDDADVPAIFWHAGSRITDRVQNWKTGDFENRAGAGNLFCQAFGVEFRRADIVAILPAPAAPPLGRAQPGNYAPADQCRSELCAATGCDVGEAEEAILRHCHAGLVPARCQKISWQVINRYGREDEESVNEAVPDWFWQHCLDNPHKVLNWTTGRFAGRGTVDGDEYRAIVTGVEFEIAAIVDIENELRSARPVPGPKSSLESVDQSAPANATGRRLSELWPHWVAELAKYIHENGIPDGVEAQGQEEVIKAIADALAHRGQGTLARATVQPVVQAVLDRLRAAEN